MNYGSQPGLVCGITGYTTDRGTLSSLVQLPLLPPKYYGDHPYRLYIARGSSNMKFYVFTYDVLSNRDSVPQRKARIHGLWYEERTVSRLQQTISCLY